MKLRNKKTGEILELCCHRSGDYREKYDSLAELNEEWEDYEEPKEYYYLNEYLELDHEMWTDTEFDNKLKALGNYFESKEEAEKAIEKLKAWKRLKDNGFRFKGWRSADLGADKYYFVIKAESDGAGRGDLDLLFGGGE